MEQESKAYLELQQVMKTPLNTVEVNQRQCPECLSPKIRFEPASEDHQTGEGIINQTSANIGGGVGLGIGAIAGLPGTIIGGLTGVVIGYFKGRSAAKRVMPPAAPPKATNTRCWVGLALVGLITGCSADKKINESWYQSRWCENQGGATEVVLADRTRCDCLTDEHAIEIDFAVKWAEALGQSLHYAALSGKAPGILLIIERKADKKYLKRLHNIIGEYDLDIKVWVTSKNELE